MDPSPDLTPVDTHLARVLDLVHPLSPLELGLLDAHGCILDEDVVAEHPLPGFDNSAMDGYAVRAADLATVPVTLPVVADLAAGPAKPGIRVQPGLCVRIMTGAMMPEGADAVVPVEWTDGGTAQVRIERTPNLGQNVRRAGEDVQAGEVVLTRGEHLGASQIGLAAAIGRPRLHVRPRPRVVVISTGSELVEPGRPLGPGMIHESNSIALTAAAVEAGAQAYRVGIVSDDPKLLMDTLEDQLVRADLVVTSGGVSVGAYDVVKQVLSRLGTVQFDTIAMQPGKPQGFGTIGPDSTPIFGLPGNPVSALVSFEVFVRPVLRKMIGAFPLERPRVSARALADFRSPKDKRSYLRVLLEVRDGAYVVSPVSGPGSHLLAGMARANALAVLDVGVERIEAGGPVPVMLLERRAR
jgi:molybdopterin molybdotransferase